VLNKIHRILIQTVSNRYIEFEFIIIIQAHKRSLDNTSDKIAVEIITEGREETD